jgi:spermidine/putrescine transport system ATP-binding protein
MQAVLADLQRQLGITFVYVTHSHSEAFSMADRVVIMSRGRIEQIGSPRDIYGAPRTRFVAEFLGSSNIFSGQVVGSDGRHVVVETGAGRLRMPLDERPLSAGEVVTFTVSGDRVQLSATAPAEDVNVIQAKVVGEEFVGATTTVHLEAADGTELRAQKSHAELAQIDIRTGQPVFVSWQVHQAHLLPAAA